MEERRAGEAHAQLRFHDVAHGAVVWQADALGRLHESAAGGRRAGVTAGQCVSEMTVLQGLMGATGRWSFTFILSSFLPLRLWEGLKPPCPLAPTAGGFVSCGVLILQSGLGLKTTF